MTEQTIVLNRRARHEYAIEETLEAGIVLTGTEIKSIRAGRVNLVDAYARSETGEAWPIGSQPPADRGGRAKLELGIGRGKKVHDKRRTIAERDRRRELERETKERVKL